MSEPKQSQSTDEVQAQRNGFAKHAAEGHGSSQRDAGGDFSGDEAQRLRDEYDRIASSLCEKHDADIMLFSGQISDATVDKAVHLVRGREPRRSNVLLLLTTYGGNPHAAYRLARFLQRAYDEFKLLVLGSCKSAGTLVAIGADRIIMSDFGELGPLDVQTSKEDDLLYHRSGLDLRQALDSIGSFTFTYFENYLFSILQRSQGAITTKTAADIASSMATGLLRPVSSQIDPLQLGEFERAMRITSQYGRRLDPKQSDAVSKLANRYPSHAYVIDIDEAKEVFNNVAEAEPEELGLEGMLFNLVRQQCDPPQIYFIDPPSPNKQERDGYNQEEEPTGSTLRDVPGNDEPHEGVEQEADTATEGPAEAERD
jgi:hypothetical protein